ncbi:response regulator [Pseudomonas savastanoi pv. glycinea]|uniref:Response regulator n=2 Tax=Pseudomonas savastanoi pv. glycinea TaxID=318 RepID=A0A3M3W2N1_PSESG|nr:fused response regulator/phosphatase [Pseudomonas savastanoi]EFW85372.1 response regulator [Pseudomonas savastanoi pv. glycinea str. race 4]MCQ3004757.1 fused response regulator/phosphatase [Pseudomonas savastanoi]RMN14968.1 response regulator [Pseudomonas savastanoi pv. glycinea]RMO52132.1 response regulator [Pseudomonas savastanoi pv. glycinea]RMU77273.1 response regulator [Pseudomonas savastanoi pv. glycinea]
MQSSPKKLCILIADDSASDRLLLSTIVARQGHRVLSAGNGVEAVAIFKAESPQLILMDAMMPVMDGFEAARRIKAMSGESLVPIIFLTSLTEGEALARCLDAGGDDFMSKPYNPLVLAAKLNAMNRLRVLHETVRQQRDQISKHHDYLLNEQRVAKAVFDQIAHAGCLGAGNIRYLQSPYALFNGDLMLAAYTPAGHMQVLLGDFTGHGLPAAVGAMPLAEVFYGMTAKGYGLVEILREMNAKLKRILPVDMFCCATLLCINLAQRQVEVWSGGLPDGYLLRGAQGEHVPLASSHLPLGVLSVDAFDARTDVYPLAPGDRIFLLSDGVLDTSNSNDELFGAQRLRQVLSANREPHLLIEEILEALNDFGGKARDDVSLLEISAVDEPLQSLPALTYSDSGASSPLDWSASFEFRASTLRRFNLLPYVLQLLLEVHGLRNQGAALHMVLGELYSNALEHGVLGLDSALKHDAAGFALYYQQRAERLGMLQTGFIRVTVRVEPVAAGGRLTLSVEDSGQGFDIEKVRMQIPAGNELYGRGLRLVCELSREARWSADGRTACVEFSWEGVA